MTRHALRLALDEQLARPLDRGQAEEYDRARWGLSPEAIAAVAAKDAFFGGAT